LDSFDNLPIGYEVNLDGNKTEYGVTNWYLKSDSSHLSGSTYTMPDRNVSFYAIANVTEITDQAGLNSIRDGLNGKYILLNDIELKADGAGFDATSGWAPIGDNSTYDDNSRFIGIFNGNNHKITGLWIKRADYVGLFGYISGSGASIKNLGVETDGDKNITGGQYVGGIAGYVYGGSISNSYATGNVSGTGRVGGIAGWVDGGSTISNSYATGSVSGTGSVGGIAGYVYDGSITNSYATGSVSGTGVYVGGIAGYVDGDSAIVQNNAAINPLVTGSSDVNRIVGGIWSGSSTISNNFALSSMSGGVNGSFSSSETKYHGTGKPADKFIAPTDLYSGFIDGDGNGGLGWDFINIWKIPNGGYPILQWQSE
jgi:hypothetical protein